MDLKILRFEKETTVLVKEFYELTKRSDFIKENRRMLTVKKKKKGAAEIFKYT